jgi:hypothetical protein
VYWYLLLLVVPIGIAAYLVWDHRRKAAQRAAVSADRLTAILGATTHIPIPDAPRAAPAVDPMLNAQRVSATEIPPKSAVYALRERFLSPPQTLLYYLLKTGLPECHVFAHVALRSVLDAAPGVSGSERNEQTRRLAWHSVDFVVCDRSLRPFAVIELARSEEPQDTAASRKSWIGSAGLRYLVFEATALPRKEALRALVLGEATANAQGSAAAGPSA